MDSAKLKRFIDEDWNWTRGLTYKFIDSIPPEKLSFSPSREFGSTGKQLRHMGAVQECYLQGMTAGKIDFSKRRRDEAIEKSAGLIVKYFQKLDTDLKQLLESIGDNDLEKEIEWIVWEDLPNPSLYQVLNYMNQHEIFHQGILQLSASVAGFKTVRFFLLDYDHKIIIGFFGRVAELAYAEDLKSSERKLLWVQIPPRPFLYQKC